MTINFYTTHDDDNNEKYIITLDITVAEAASMTADELGTIIKEALEAPIGG